MGCLVTTTFTKSRGWCRGPGYSMFCIRASYVELVSITMSRHVWTLLLASVQHNTLHATASVQCPYLENHGSPELVNLPPPSIYDLDSKPTATTNCFKTINCRERYSFMIIWPIRGSVLHIRLCAPWAARIIRISGIMWSAVTAH